MIWTTQNTITDVLPVWWGTPYFSWHVMEYLNDQFPDRWIGHSSLQNWTLWSLDHTSPKFSCMGLHENHNIWMQSKQNTEYRSYFIKFFMLQGAWIALMFYTRFKPPWISNISSSVNVENQMYIHMTLLTGNDLRNKILKYWHKITWHPVFVTPEPSFFSHCFHIWLLFWMAKDLGKEWDTEQHTMPSYKPLKSDTWTVLCMAMTQTT
jgi:hypothetical protein